MINRKGLIVSFIILSAWTITQAQNPFIRFYTTTDGLPSNAINIIVQDSEKFLWIATDAGLVRFDGSEFKKYTTADGLSRNQVIVIKEDNRKRVWLFCSGAQPNYFYRGKIYNRKNAPFLDNFRGNWTFSISMQHILGESGISYLYFLSMIDTFILTGVLNSLQVASR